MSKETRLRLPKFYKKYSADMKRMTEEQFAEKMYGETKKSAREIIQEAKSVSPFRPKLSKGKYQTFVILGCVHRPFHNKKLWAAVLNLIYDLRPTLGGLILNGDFLDLLSLSGHSVGEVPFPDINLGVEYKDGLQGIIELEQAIGDRKIQKCFIYGNHENRYYRHLKKMENARYGSALLSPREALRLDEFGYEVQPDYQNGAVHIGDALEVFHGHYFSVHAAKKHLDAVKSKSVIFNHTHRFQSFGDGVHTAYNTGWLGDVNHPVFNYANRFTKSMWKNGFAVVHLTDGGEAVVNPVECINDQFFFGGKIY